MTGQSNMTGPDENDGPKLTEQGRFLGQQELQVMDDGESEFGRARGHKGEQRDLDALQNIALHAAHVAGKIQKQLARRLPGTRHPHVSGRF